MNILSNAVQAIKEKPIIAEAEKILITTRNISDNQIELMPTVERECRKK